MADSTPSNAQNKWQKFLSKTNALLLSFKIPILTLTTILLFKEVFEDLASSIFVKPLLSKFSKSYISDTIFLISSIFCLSKAYFWYKKKFIIPNTLVIISFLTPCIYIYYRLSQKVWIFKSLEITPFIKYLDIIPILCFSVILSQLFRFKNNSRIEQSTNTTNDIFYADNPIIDEDKDSLGRKDLAKSIALRIKNTQNSLSALAIGISGEWGSGKTSFLNLIEQNIGKDNYIIIKFNPWINQDSKSIIKDFFNTLSDELSKYHFNVYSALKDYSDILSGVGDNNLNKILSPFLKFISQKESVASEFDKINSIIKNINKKIIIFIDDVDRLHKDEIIQVMKLIRNSANFTNTTFVVAYDRIYLVSAIKDINPQNPENYLEKIFQYELTLPNIELKYIQDKLFNLLNHRVSTQDIEILKELISDGVVDPHSGMNEYDAIFGSGGLSTLRDITRFINSFLVSYDLLKGEVIIEDLFHIEVLRFKYPEVYKLLFFEREKFLEKIVSAKQWYYSLKHPEEYIGGVSEKIPAPNDPIIKTYLVDNYATIGINKNDIDTIMFLLLLIFPERFISPSHHKLLSIIYPSSFERYSYYRLLDSNLSYVEFSNTRKNDSLEVFCGKIDAWIKKDLLSDIVNYFECIEDFDNLEDFEKTINAMFHLGQIIPNQYNYDDLYSKLFLLGQSYYSKRQELKNFIINLLRKTPTSCVFEMRFINHILERIIFDKLQGQGVMPYFMVSENILNYLRKKLLKSYIKHNRGFHNADLWRLYKMTHNKKYKPFGNQYESYFENNSDIDKIILDLIKKELDSFLFFAVHSNKKNNSFRIRDEVSLIFNDTSISLDVFLENLDVNNSLYLEEFKKFYAEYEANGYRFVEFKFSENFKEVIE